jgi:tetratricopeptide (TPR) repeat protein
LRNSLATRNELIARGGANVRVEGELANNYLSLGLVLRKSNHSADAIEAYRRAISLFKNTGNEDRLATAWRDLAIAYRKEGRLHEALAAYTEARNILSALVQFSPDSVRLQTEFAETAHGIALVHSELGQSHEAIPLLVEAVTAQKAVVNLTPDVVIYRLTLRNQTFALAETYRKIHNHIRAAAALEDFLKLAVDPIDYVNAAAELVECRTIAMSDLELPEARRRELGDEYGLRAIQVLCAAKEKDPNVSKFIRSDNRFDPLRAYEEFSTLMEQKETEITEK